MRNHGKSADVINQTLEENLIFWSPNFGQEQSILYVKLGKKRKKMYILNTYLFRTR